ncbi:family 55 glycoside hydrolase [Delphinella strobiligena]|nr:family 55 glycoside hydrolase [Delphinella strobiligena]
MRSINSISLFGLFTTLTTLFLIFGPVAPVAASPVSIEKRASSSYWLANIARNGKVAFGSDSYTVYRNVMDYGAKGDGTTDDTAAINSAITAGSRCGLGCDSSTVTPAIVYFPPGTYKISTPIIQYYYTQLIGDAINPPTITADSSFVGIALIDADPYESNGDNWYTNQNNFFRQIRNFVINLKPMGKSGSGIHWQVAQATSLQNIVFDMYAGSDSTQQGIFMDNGSGGFMSDLVFNGGNYGAFLGNQQFTSRNWTFNNCNTAIFMNWNWAWTLKSVTINNCGVGIDMSNGGSTAQTVGSIILMDSKISNTPIGIKTAFSLSGSSPTTSGTLVIDNVDFSTNVPIAVSSTSGSSVLAGNTKVTLWRQGREYTGATGSRVQAAASGPSKPAALLSSSGAFFERSKPQYQSYAASAFVSVKGSAYGAVGDGVTDDTAAIQAAMNAVGADTSKILYFDHGAYLITKTIQVPANIKMTGEIWPLIMASGSFFQDETSPQPVFNIGTAGASGNVEISDLIFETKGAAPGAIMIKWNIVSAAGGSGMWDTHVRIGGSAGTELQSDTCAKNPTVTSNGNTACEGAFLLFWATPQSGGIYLENTWFWVADHELDLADHNQINIFNGRGVLLENAGGPAWLYGTSSEHSIFYNYQVINAENVFMGMIQTETPYFQANPKAPEPLSLGNSGWGSNSDPNWGWCDTEASLSNSTCYKTWGLRIIDSTNVFVHGAGLYSFFDNYSQDCLAGEDCQRNIIGIQGTISNLNMYAINTKASYSMLTLAGVPQALDSDNRNNFCATLFSIR